MAETSEPSHDLISNTLYRMQFILGPHFPTGYDDWQQVKVGEELCLIAHPHLNVEQAAGTSVSVTLIGYLLDPCSPQASNDEILNSLISSLEQGRDLFESTYSLGGRWILLVNSGQGSRMLSDAAGLRQIFYSDPQQTNELWCASQSLHIGSLLGLELDPEALEFIEWFQTKTQESWWPGDSSPYKEIRRLLPNHYLDLTTGKARRFWPLKSIKKRSLKHSLNAIAENLTALMKSAANRFELAIASSAGWDSRLMIAACRPIAKELGYYTAKRPDMAWSHMDVRIPTRLLKKLELPHDIIESGSEATPDFIEAYNKNVLFSHPTRLAPLQAEMNYYGRKKIGVTGNVSEVARCFYWPPASPSKEVNAEHLMSVTGMEHPFAKTQFDAWMDDIGNTRGYDILDLFYWEQRVGSWFANNCLEFDSAWRDIFIPFNSRQLLADMLAVDKVFRKGPDYDLYRRLIKKMWPEVLSEPINPAEKRKSLRDYLRAIRRHLKRLLIRLGLIT